MTEGLPEAGPQILEEIEDGAVIGDGEAVYLDLGQVSITFSPTTAREVAAALKKVADQLDPQDDEAGA